MDMLQTYFFRLLHKRDRPTAFPKNRRGQELPELSNVEFCRSLLFARC